MSKKLYEDNRGKNKKSWVKTTKVLLPLRDVKKGSHVMIVVVQLWMKY